MERDEERRRDQNPTVVRAGAGAGAGAGIRAIEVAGKRARVFWRRASI